jgi:hypothetical protein
MNAEQLKAEALQRIRTGDATIKEVLQWLNNNGIVIFTTVNKKKL